MRFIYNIAAIIAVIIFIPAFIIRAIREKGFVERIKQQLGFVPKRALDKVARKNCIWVHAASVGEIVAASPLIKEFHKEFPKSPILVSVFTNSGYEMANRIIKDADSIIYMPFDLPWLTPHFIYKIRPMVFLPVETELWPNLLLRAKELDIPVMMVNGRISEKSVNRYRYLSTLWDEMVNTITMFAMQSPIDADYIKQLGANPELVVVTGNTKYDQTYTDVKPSEKKRFINELGIADNQGIFLAGSTHKGEEEHVLAAFKKIRESFPKAKLVIAPRAVLRTGAVQALCTENGFTSTTRTELNEKPSSGHDVVILNTVGELGKIYSIGDVIYVGGSLIPHGGHNILEPAAHGKAIITGNQMFNFKDTHALFSKRNAVITVKDGGELAEAAAMLFNDTAKRHQMEEETLSIVMENRGAARRSAKILHKVVDAVEQKHKIKATDKVENFQTYFMQLIHSKQSKGILTRFLIGILYLFSKAYGFLVNLKLAGYRAGIFSKKKLGCYVISLGNITVGGTGKTPTAQRMAKTIRDMGYKVVILNRGYRSKWQGGDVGVVSDGKTLHMDAATAGDEAFMLAKHLPNVPVLIGPERAKTGRYAIEHFGAEVAILDDGYQHWQLQRDMDIVLIDAVNVFGNEHMLPRGTLREPISHIERARVCLLTKVDQAAAGSITYIREHVKHYAPNSLIVESIHQPQSLIELADWHKNIASEGMPISTIAGKRVVAVSAIGNPQSFEQTLYDTGAELLESLRFPDHHEYTPEEMADVIQQVRRLGGEAIVTTEKDAVKIPISAFSRDLAGSIPIYVITIEVVIKNGENELFSLIDKELKSHLGK